MSAAAQACALRTVAARAGPATHSVTRARCQLNQRQGRSPSINSTRHSQAVILNEFTGASTGPGAERVL